MDMKLDEALAAYRGGIRADILQAEIDGKWGPIWTIPPCSPVAIERAGRQFTRCRVQKLRHFRHARLRGPSSCTDVIVMTELPSRQQDVARVKDGVTLQVRTFLEDEALSALKASFVPFSR